MRRRVALVSMALGLISASQVNALDATHVVYDLTELQGQTASAPSPHGESQSLGLPMGSLPISTPSIGSTDGFLESGSDLEILGRHRNTGRTGQGVHAPRGGGSGGSGDHQNNDNNPTPNPEPGSLILLGGAIAAGARRLRRRA